MSGLFLSIGLKLLAGGKWLLAAAGKALAWLVEEPARLLVVALAGALAWQLLIVTPGLRADLAKEAKRADDAEASQLAWETAYWKFAGDVADAQAKARAADEANVARVEREYRQINERTAHAYQARLADTRAALERVRRQYAAAPAGDAGGGRGADVPEALSARCRALGATDCYDLLAALPDKLAAAEENTGKLIDLQDYVRSSLAIDYSGVPDRPTAALLEAGQ